MSRRYQSSEENQAYKEGYRDNEQGRRDYYHNKYAMEGIDRAYWDGRKDNEREKRECKEQEEMERQAQEEDARKQEQQRREEEDEYNQYLQAKMEQQMEDDLATIPSTEEELFMQIEEDERENSINQKPDENEQKD